MSYKYYELTGSDVRGKFVAGKPALHFERDLPR
jgi:hypothetical protein